MTRCKVGDLAYIVASHCNNDGVIVEVIGRGPDIDGPNTWHCRSLHPVQLLNGWISRDGHIADERLRPISGVPLNDETPTAIETPIATNIGVSAQGWL